MIALRANEAWLDFNPKSSLSISIISPVFDRDRIDRSYSFPFNLPATPTNLKALGHPHRLDAATSVKHPAQLYIEGNLFEDGLLTITGSSDKEIRCVFQSKSINLADTLRSIRLRQLNIVQEITTEYCPQIIIGSVYPVPTGGIERMALRINEHVFDTLITELDEMISQINAIFGPIASEPVLGQPFNENLILFSCPIPEDFRIYLAVEVDDPGIYVFFSPVDSSFDTEAERINTEYQALVSAGGNDTLAFPTIAAPNLYDGKNPSYSGYANYTDISQQHPNDAGTFIGSDGWPHTLIPMPYAAAILPYIAAAAGLSSIGGSFWAYDEIASIVVWNNRTLDLVAAAEDYIVDRAPTNQVHTYNPTISLAKHLPDISAFDFLNAIANTFCLVARYRLGRLEYTACRDLLNTQPEDWTEYAEPQYRQEIRDISAYTLDYERQGDETEFPGQLERIDGGDDAVEFKPTFFTLFELAETDSIDDSRSWRIPYIAEQGFVPHYDLEDAASLRLLFYRGWQPDSEGNNYPLATHGPLNHLGADVGAYSLAWPGSAGLYQQWWKDYIAAQVNGKEVTRVLRLPAHKLLELKNNPFRRIAIYSPHGAIVGYLKSLRFRASTQGVTLTEATIVVT